MQYFFTAMSTAWKALLFSALGLLLLFIAMCAGLGSDDYDYEQHMEEEGYNYQQPGS